ncbi:PREDICTED: cyclin-dependent kinase inhibitor 3-like [Ipomoea nil]|uniref:cyclin-dependent kinase inhibitor 3-like n=1 Tax=Ipomoea nil TaxID=35883 RepID=UPI000901F9DB|nr:PREDICTED: cyclin-dependent kinase inhibitor 3-like [Ipomoea nil]
MGKYMKKGKITADVAVMDLSESPLGVRTRAKTLALQRLQSQSDSDSDYLQLRSRRLQKHTSSFREDCKKFAQKRHCQEAPESVTCQKWKLESSSRLRVGSANSTSASITRSDTKEGCLQVLGEGYEAEESYDLGVQASFGENNLEFEARDRSTRESTPCSLIREEDTIKAPNSATKRTNQTTRTRSSVLRTMPSAEEIDEFFAYAEQQQQRLFIEKYNFDIVNDLPLPGRYEWVRVSQ